MAVVLKCECASESPGVLFWKDFLNWSLEQKREKHCMRAVYRSAASCIPLPGIEPTTQLCVLTNNLTDNLLVHRTTQPTEPLQPGTWRAFWNTEFLIQWVLALDSRIGISNTQVIRTLLVLGSHFEKHCLKFSEKDNIWPWSLLGWVNYMGL